ncbi:aldolase/citrate lyase family protein [Vulcanisaeta souniana]|uniref:aldolase/citrate lyase family protein n=1 Tax=Vulcanisaeta souniana TaxID=164452 RepID=UPI001FB4811F|nr:aldolase/citrate lyase family protein [Vulcanisaeta souniana]
MLRRSQLFVPGNNERMIRKAALELRPDSVIIDLEDAVPVDEKETARKLIRELLPQLDWMVRNSVLELMTQGPPHSFTRILIPYIG